MRYDANGEVHLLSNYPTFCQQTQATMRRKKPHRCSIDGAHEDLPAIRSRRNVVKLPGSVNSEQRNQREREGALNPNILDAG